MNQKLINDINIDLENMKVIVNEIEQLLIYLEKNEPNNIQKTALAAFVSQFYTGIENIIKRIHKHNNIPLPKAEDWHIQILKRCATNSEFNFPLKFGNELYQSLNELRRFRHYFFHGYSINIDWGVLKESIIEISDIYKSFIVDLSKLMDNSDRK